VANKFAERGRVLAVDGYVCYDVQDESSRESAKRPFPYRPLWESSSFARLLSSAAHKECVVYKAVTCMQSVDHFNVWLDKCVDQDCHSAINIVGAPSSDTVPTGPSTKEASLIAAKRKAVRFGAVCIAERHITKKAEHIIMGKKASWGAEWFITQGIYDPEPMIQVIKDYARLCQDEKKVPKKIILTFAPCGRRKTLEFIKWLGMQVPPEAEERMFAASDAALAAAAGAITPVAPGATKPKRLKPPVQLSCELLCDNLRRILQETSGSGVPLGVNVESVSGFKDEIDATHDLFRSLQAILLDYTGSPWVVRWSRLDHVLLRKRASIEYRRASIDQRRSMDEQRPPIDSPSRTHQAVQYVVQSKPQAGPLQMAVMVAASIGFGALVARK